jgi:hypothetical protein
LTIELAVVLAVVLGGGDGITWEGIGIETYRAAFVVQRPWCGMWCDVLYRSIRYVLLGVGDKALETMANKVFGVFDDGIWR